MIRAIATLHHHPLLCLPHEMQTHLLQTHYVFFGLVDTQIRMCTWKHELLILCSNFHSLIDMFNACNSSETDYCRRATITAAQCTTSRPVLLIGELCDWTIIMKCLQMQCNGQPIICLFISLCVCISRFFYLLAINFLFERIWWRRWRGRWCWWWCWCDRWLVFSVYVGRLNVASVHIEQLPF